MYFGKLRNDEKVILERVEVELMRRPGTELDLYDGYFKVPEAIASSLQVADWSVPGEFPNPPSYILEIDDPHFVRTASQLSIFIDQIQQGDKSGLATVRFLTALPYDAAWG